MAAKSAVFEENYNDYCARLAETDFSRISRILGIRLENNRLAVPFFQTTCHVSGDGITDASGNRPDYITCVILARYILNCPDEPHNDPDWVSFKDFKKEAAVLNVNFFTSDTEQAIVKAFSGRFDALENACQQTGGTPHKADYPYDLVMQFTALPQISLLLLFNDKDDEFPAACSVLFNRHAEEYLDPESLAMTSAVLARKLKKGA
ncbi:MAG: DUF3786 domain-containing protein [Thermodesulfobacteriota bacterium]|nr:DUF3786 domain-containing protein [Thermodesulfobacteriota bacterium]